MLRTFAAGMEAPEAKGETRENVREKPIACIGLSAQFQVVTASHDPPSCDPESSFKTSSGV